MRLVNYMIVPLIDDGVSQGDGHCSIVFKAVDSSSNDIEYDSMYLEWSKSTEPVMLELGFIASSIVQFIDEVIVLGRLGQIIVIKNGEVSHEEIIGPDKYGFLTDIKVIGNSVFSSGMSRQIYIRNKNNTWGKFDFGVLDDVMGGGVVTGFREIDGLSVEDIYAVGLEGEIWNYRNNEWKKIVSPTNVILEQVKVVSANDVYAVGQAGVILHGNDGVWEVIDQTITSDDFWGLEWFNDSIYIASATKIYMLNLDNELEIIIPKEKFPKHFSRLRVSKEVLWSFSGDEAYWTKNGIIWEEANIFKSSDIR